MNGSGGARRDRTDDLKLAKLALSQLSYGPDLLACLAVARGNKRPPSPFGLRRGSLLSLRERRLVGLGRVELPTSRLSSARSNQLSYRPNSASAPLCDLKERETKTAVSRKWDLTLVPYIQMTLR